MNQRMSGREVAEKIVNDEPFLFDDAAMFLAKEHLALLERVKKLEKVVEEAKFMRMLLKKHDSFDKALKLLGSEATLDDLDRLAAEKVMGWTIVGEEYRLDESEKSRRLGSSKRWWDKWEPTRNIAQAWECLQKMRDPLLPKNQQFFYRVSHGACTLERMVYDGDPDEFHAEDFPDSECIVRACLKAKGVEIG